ncbi:hypothetical protein [Butyrivibrio sp. FCS014]|uniref:hypothetical protein n=1 Tax=Butyrivibrio sp. FCS014 TaxID=1408304 RepID=UPI000463F189|nr:hypothetical protein [Butyrivibrio sp. FCS014]
MFTNGKRFIISFAAAIVLLMTAALGIAHHSYNIIGMSDEFLARSEDVLRDYLNNKGAAHEAIGLGLSDTRLSQQVTVTTLNGFMTVGGTVTKCEDEFYPGTYEVKFSRKTILPSSAMVSVKLDVTPGDTVYVLTGSKDTGYRQYASVTAGENGLVAFNTNVIRDYTISTTDIQGAQKAMETLFVYNTVEN